MSDYINPDAPNPEISAAIVRSMQMANNGYAPTPTSGYYPGGYANPFASQNNASYSPESRANIGPTTPTGMPMQYPYGQQTAPQYQPVQSAPTFNGLAEMKNINNPVVEAAWLAQLQPPVQVPATGYSGYPIGVDANNYIYEYMKSHPTTKPTWGENYWTSPKPIDPPMIDWTPKQQEAPVYPYQQYGYGYANAPQQPTLPQNFAFPAAEPSLLDTAKKNWNNWGKL
jgi:hypothetical protein